MKSFIGKNQIYIIAEIGINHNGNLNIAKKLIDYASAAGCNAVKFQTYITDDIILRSQELASYQKITNFKNQYNMLKNYELSFDDFRYLKKYCLKKKITFLSTPFDNKSAFFLNKIKVPFFKISSADIDNYHLLNFIKKFKKPIIISTGMSDEKKIKKTINFLKLNRNKLAILHCVSEYPTVLKNTNLGFINKLKNYGYDFGVSDHTTGNEFAIASVALGAKIVEKHITLSNKSTGPDHISSLEVKYLKKFVSTVRNLFHSLKDIKKKKTKIEIENLDKTQRRLFLTKNIKEYKEIKYDDILPLRSNNKKLILAKDTFKIVGKKTKKKLYKNNGIEWKNIK